MGHKENGNSLKIKSKTILRMNQFLRLILMVLLVGCAITSNKKPIIINSEFLKIIEMYMKEFSEIPNSCNHKPY